MNLQSVGRLLKSVVSPARSEKADVWGVDWRRDVLKLTQRHNVLCEGCVCVDVGAHTGEVATQLAAMFPMGMVYAFEMVPETFAVLQKNVRHAERIVARQIGLSSSSGEVVIQASGMSQRNSLSNVWSLKGAEVRVQTKTLDQVASESCIDRVVLLKTDTEGHDLAVLQGGAGLLSGGKIEYVIVEVGLHSRDEQHSDFVAVRELLESFDYACVGVYCQWRPVVIGHWADALFVRRIHLQRDWRGVVP